MLITVFKDKKFTYIKDRGFEAYLTKNQINFIEQNIQSIKEDGIIGNFLYNSHGGDYPYELEDTIYEFFSEGGGFISIGEAPFENAYKYQNGTWVKFIRTFSDLRENKSDIEMDVDYFRAKLGMLVYENAFSENSGTLVIKDSAFEEEIRIPICNSRGINISNSLPMHTVNKDMYLKDNRGYMARPACRFSHDAGLVYDKSGSLMSTNFLLTKFYGNPYNTNQSIFPKPWAVLFTENAALPDKIFDIILRWISNECFIKEVTPKLCMLYPGEKTNIEVKLTGKLQKGYKLKVLKKNNEGKYLLVENFLSEDKFYFEVEYNEKNFVTEYKVMVVDKNDAVCDYMEQGIVNYRSLEKSVPLAKVDGTFFSLDDKTSYFIGANWQDRSLFAFTWHKPNPIEIIRDVEKIKEAGIMMVRSHFMMPGWFKQVPNSIYKGCGLDEFDSFENGPLLSENHLRALELHLMIFAKYRLYFMPTIYTNPSTLMGNPSHWMRASRAFINPSMIENQRIFAEQVMERMGGYQNAIWDLYNEPDTNMTQVGKWIGLMKEVWAKKGHLVSVGTFTLEQNMKMGENADFHSSHQPCCKTADEFHSGKPVIFQEAWVPAPCDKEGETDLEIVMDKSIALSLSMGACGFMPWNFNMSYMNWRYGGSFVDYWDLELGACVHADLTDRRGYYVMKQWAEFLCGLEFIKHKHDQVVLVYPQNVVECAGYCEYVDLLNDMGIEFSMCNDSDFKDKDLSKTKLVIFPFYGLGFRDATYEKAKHFSEQDGQVFCHLASIDYDEQGLYKQERILPYIETEKDNWYYALGRNTGEPKVTNELLLKILNSLDLHKKDNKLYLKDGYIKVYNKLSKNEKTMRTDWVPNQKLPDRDIVSKLEVVSAGITERVYINHGELFEFNKIKVTSNEFNFVYVIDRQTIIVCGNSFGLDVRNNYEFPNILLVDDTGNEIDDKLEIINTGGLYHVNLNGYQRKYKVKIRISA